MNQIVNKKFIETIELDNFGLNLIFLIILLLDLKLIRADTGEEAISLFRLFN